VIPTAKGTRICPGFGGATNWFSPSYNPVTKLFYFLADEDCNIYYLKPENLQKEKPIIQPACSAALETIRKNFCWLTASNLTKLHALRANRCRAFFPVE